MRPKGVRLLALCLAPVLLCLFLLLLMPVVGLVASIAFAIVLHPFGRTLVERFAVWLIMFLAVVGVGFLVVGLRVTAVTAIALLLAGVAASGALTAARADASGAGPIRGALPTVGALDVAVLLTGAVEAYWLLRPFIGVGNIGKLARLFVGWDFHTHFVLFADTFQYGRLADITIGSSPEFATSATLLHPSLWALLAHAAAGPGAHPSRQHREQGEYRRGLRGTAHVDHRPAHEPSRGQ